MTHDAATKSAQNSLCSLVFSVEDTPAQFPLRNGKTHFRMKPLPPTFLKGILPNAFAASARRRRVLHLPFTIYHLPFIFCLGFSCFLSAQQEPHFTKYMFNSLIYNPGYAGSKEYLSVVALHRDQWFGWGGKEGGGYDGRPVTQTFSLHSPVNRRVGLGFNVLNDRIGARSSTLFNACYAYRVSFGEGTLSLGLLAGMMHWQADWDQLDFQEPRELDLAFDGQNPNLWLPDFGTGIYYYSGKFYAGASIPHLLHFYLRDLSAPEQDVIRKWARSYRHFYLTTGGVIPLGKGNGTVLRPSILIKSVGFFQEFFKEGSLVREIGAPAGFDADLSLLFHDRLWIGGSFRSSFAAFSPKNEQGSQDKYRSSHDSVNGWFSWQLDNGMRIGFAYDYPLSPIQAYSPGSFEVMLGFDYFKKVEKTSSPRYF